jgi:hypothetical protein
MPDLNIKNPEAYRLVKELSDATGQSMTQVIIDSVRERLSQVRGQGDADIEADVQRILDLARIIRENSPPGYFEQDFDALLYDEDGLPK